MDVVGLAVLVVTLGPVLVMVLKGKWLLALGVYLLSALLFGFFGFVGTPVWLAVTLVAAIRLAKPTSFWARRFYDAEKQRAAEARFRPELDRGAVEESAVEAEGEQGEVPEGARWVCSACGRYFPDEAAAMTHADEGHLELRFEDAKAALKQV